MVIAVTNRKLCQDDFIARIRELLDADPFEVILREKDLTDEEYRSLAEKIISGHEEYKKILSLNRPETASELGIKNVHLTMGQITQSGRPDIERVGVSVHSSDEAKTAEKLGADYLIAGHIFTTDCKKGIPPRGLDFFREVCNSVSIPVFAIGGICQENFKQPLECGGAGVCLMSEFMKCDRPFERIKIYR